ncbi:Protein transport protein sec1 [Diplonema papillatum]|nr:Protein transport protein sec1 [Diplonema papillatum]
MAGGPQPPGLQRALKQRLETEVFQAPSEQCRQLGSVLVCDDWSLSLLESVFKVNDLTKHGVPLVEDLRLGCGVRGGRQSLPRNPVVYLCRCDAKNVAAILADWTESSDGNPKDWEARPYAEAHVFFTSRTETSLTDRFKNARLLLRHLKSLKALNLDFLCPEPNTFSLQVEHDLQKFFGKQRAPGELDQTVTSIAHQIVDVIATMGDTVTVRHQKGSSCTIAYQVAKKVVDVQQKRLGKKQGEATLLILDRSVDAAAPLLHELTYQAMLLDILPNDPAPEGIKVKKEVIPGRARVTVDGKAVQIDETDDLWCRFRHQHIADNAPVVAKEFKDLVANSKALSLPKSNTGEVVSTDDVKKALQEVPQVKAKLSRYGLHVDLHAVLMKQKSLGLDSACALEQDLVTHETKDGAKIDKDEVKKQFEAFLETSGTGSFQNKVRLLLLYIISQGALSPDRQTKWVSRIGTGGWNSATGWEKGGPTMLNLLVTNLAQLDVVTVKKKWYQTKQKKKKSTVDQYGYDWSRYVPSVKSFAEHLAQGDLAEAECPHTVGEEAVGAIAPSSSSAGRSQRPRGDGYAQRSWGTSLRSGEQTAAAGASAASYPALPWTLNKVKSGSQRYYVFIVGGATFSETRSIAELIAEKEVEIILGSTSFITSNEYLQNLSEL